VPSATIRVATTCISAAVAVAAVLASCGSPPAPGAADHSTSSTVATAGQPADYNADDITFAQQMISHHGQAIDLSTLVPGRSTDPQLIKLASEISTGQDAEVRTLNVLLVQWNADPDEEKGHGAAAMPVAGVVDAATMNKLASLKGTEFDTLWMQSMIGHHRGAIQMAQVEVANGANVDAIGLANNIVTTEQAQIDQMMKMSGG